MARPGLVFGVGLAEVRLGESFHVPGHHEASVLGVGGGVRTISAQEAVVGRERVRGQLKRVLYHALQVGFVLVLKVCVTKRYAVINTILLSVSVCLAKNMNL